MLSPFSITLHTSSPATKNPTMKRSCLVPVLLCCWAAALCCGVTSAKHHHASGAPAPAPDCSSAMLGLADCLTFVEQGSKEKKPGAQCCAGLKKIVKEEASCLCQGLAGGGSLGISLDMTKAMALPSACGLKTSPISNCHLAPGAAPGLSPAAAPSGSTTTGQQGTTAGAPAPSPMQSAAVSVPAASLAARLFAVAVAFVI